MRCIDRSPSKQMGRPMSGTLNPGTDNDTQFNGNTSSPNAYPVNVTLVTWDLAEYSIGFIFDKSGQINTKHDEACSQHKQDPWDNFCFCLR